MPSVLDEGAWDLSEQSDALVFGLSLAALKTISRRFRLASFQRLTRRLMSVAMKNNAASSPALIGSDSGNNHFKIPIR